MHASQEFLEIQLGDIRLVMDPSLGGRAVSWCIDDHELLYRHGDSPVEYGMYPMAPWAGRIRDNTVNVEGRPHQLPTNYGPWALHGTIFEQSMQVIEHTTSEERVFVAFEASQPSSWPWPMVVGVTWTLTMNSVTTRIEVEATEEPFPCVVGWHPWFRRDINGSSAQWSIDADAMLQRDDGSLPIDIGAPRADAPVDDAFRVPSREARITWPGLLHLQVHNDSPWFVVFDQQQDFVCVEPQSGPPDGLADRPWSSPRFAAAGAPLIQEVTWTICDLRSDENS